MFLGASAVAANANADEQANKLPIVAIERIVLSEAANQGTARPLTLPVHEYRDGRVLTALSATAEFQMPVEPGHAKWALYAQALHDGGTMFINGVQVGDVQTSDERHTVRFIRPYLFAIPADVLRPGVNTLERRWSVRESQILFPRLFIGPQSLLQGIYERQYFWQNTMAQVSLIISLVIALLLLGMYALNRSAVQYFWVGSSAAGWGLLNLAYVMPPIPAWVFPYWHMLLYTGISLFAIGGWLFVLIEAERHDRRYQTICLTWSVAFVATYVLNYAVTGRTLLPVLTPIWNVGLSVLGLYPIWVLVGAVRRQRKWRHVAYLAIACSAIVAGSLDVALMMGQQVAGINGYVLQVVAPLWFGVVCFILIGDFSRHFRAQQAHKLQLMAELAAQKEELDRLYAQERIVQEKQAAAHERARIMQDMHDGLGSQLVSSLALAQTGGLSSEQTYALLRGCIDDLRLAIDSAGESGESLALALGNLRFRMEPRLKAAGIELRWDTAGLDLERPVAPEAQLPILRVIQESITNTLKHAHASTLTVRVGHERGVLRVDISDNGQGFDLVATLQNPHGKGLNSLHKRARALGAALDIQSSADGTHTRLALPA